MSYCRWSSDNWTCDLYMYEDVSGGWTLHLAGNRAVGVPVLPPYPVIAAGITSEQLAARPDFAAWCAAYNQQLAYLRDCPRVDIQAEWAGETYYLGSLEDVEAKLLELRAAGCVFGDYVLEEVRREILEEREDE